MSEELILNHHNETGFKGFAGYVSRVISGMALGSAAAIGSVFLTSNFSSVTRLEAELFQNLLMFFKSGSPPQIMAMHPVVVPILIVIVLIFCVISALTIRTEQVKLVTYAITTYRHVTTCAWTASVLGFLYCLLTTIVLVFLTLVQVVVVYLMYITLLINILAVVIMIFS